MAFDPHQLDELRAAVRMSELVGAKFKLRKSGSEFVCIDDPSMTVNDQKGIYWDFSQEGRGGDCIDYLTKEEGFTFIGAVEELARRTGIELRQRPGTSNGSNGAHVHDRPVHAGDAGAGANQDEAAPARDHAEKAGKREVVGTWDYIDPENVLLYQVVRMQERLADGEWRRNREGKIWKTFAQRRPSPDGDGSWVWGLDVVGKDGPIEFMRSKEGAPWVRATDDRKQTWKHFEVRTFPGARFIDHWLYNANEAIDELREPPEDQRTIFLPEGEGKVDVLKEWGLLAVSNSGGAQNFSAECAEFFRGAADLVILMDNDRAGGERVARIAPMLRAVGARVRTLNFRDVWPSCPEKGDIKDWRENGGGTRDQLLEIVDSLQDWQPQPYRSKFGAKTAHDLAAPTRQYPWRVKFLIPRNDDTLIMGPSRSGKTFMALDLCMHVHFGKPFAGKKVEQGGIVYLTYEGAAGFENRLRAYMHHHGIKPEDLHSFAWLTRPPGLYATEDSAKALASEVMEITKNFRHPLSHTVVDTHNAATRGSSEIKSEDINRIQTNYGLVRELTQAPLWIIGHTNSEGRHRGNEQIYNGTDTALAVERVYKEQGKNKIEERDDDGRVIRRLRVDKQRDGDDGIKINFVLQNVELGKDEDGDDIISMVTAEPAQAVPSELPKETRRDKHVGFFLNAREVEIFKKLIKVTDDHGIVPPKELELPTSIPKVARWLDLSREYRKGVPKNEGESQDKYSNRVKAHGNRFKAILMNRDNPVIIVREAVDPVDSKVAHFVWWTGRPVQGPGFQWPKVAPPKKEQKPILAPGESEDDIPDDLT